jgi:NADH-quinone oxidoreductase subunit J
MDGSVIGFYVFATITVLASLGVVGQRNPMYSVMLLITSFGALAGLYVLLEAPFTAVTQIIIYAGAIMVLFLFVMMLLGAEQVEATPDRIAWQRPLGLVLGIALLGLAVAAAFRGAADTAPPTGEGVATFGDPYSIGALLFTQYMLPFQITGIILLIAVVGVVVLNQRGRTSVPAKPPAGD